MQLSINRLELVSQFLPDYRPTATLGHRSRMDRVVEGTTVTQGREQVVSVLRQYDLGLF